MTAQSQRLLELGRSILGEFQKIPQARCGMITGSSAEGHADDYSDLDMTVYYESLPGEEEIAAARMRARGGEVTWIIGDPKDGDYAHAFRVDNVEVQIGHCTIARWQADVDRTLRGEEPAGVLHKAMSGTLYCIPVFGEPIMQKWKSQLRDYPDVLRDAMIKHHLSFFPVWGVIERLGTRDATLWFRTSIGESSFNILGALSGLNRQYFTAFQFKRARSFIDTLELKPKNLADRLDALWDLPMRGAALALRSIVEETVALVERHAPHIDASVPRKQLARTDHKWTT